MQQSSRLSRKPALRRAILRLSLSLRNTRIVLCSADSELYSCFRFRKSSFIRCGLPSKSTLRNDQRAYCSAKFEHVGGKSGKSSRILYLSERIHDDFGRKMQRCERMRTQSFSMCIRSQVFEHGRWLHVFLSARHFRRSRN
jgi:hypothetical protein